MATPSVKELIGSVVCGCGKIVNQFPVRGRLRKHCSDACRVKASEANRKEKIAKYQAEYRSRKRGVVDNKCLTCGNALDSNRNKYCCKECRPKPQTITGKTRQDIYSERIAKNTHTCRYCGKVFRNRRGTEEGSKFCSRECSFKEKAELSKPKFSAVHFIACKCCSKLFTSRRVNVACCSDLCKKLDASQKKKVFAASKKEVKKRACKQCGKEFKNHYGHYSKYFCGSVCGKMHARHTSKAKRRALVNGADYERFSVYSVFNRGKWTCMICGVHTPRSLRGTYEPNAPELDHIIPVSKGGAHTMANTQCACRSCNGKKSDSLTYIPPGDVCFSRVLAL